MRAWCARRLSATLLSFLLIEVLLDDLSVIVPELLGFICRDYDWSTSRMASAQHACALEQLGRDLLLLGDGRRQSINESLNVTDETLVALFRQQTGDRAPSAFDGLPCFYEFVLAGVGPNVPFEKFGSNGFGLRADVCRIAAQARAVDSVRFQTPRSLPHGPRVPWHWRLSLLHASVARIPDAIRAK